MSVQSTRSRETGCGCFFVLGFVRRAYARFCEWQAPFIVQLEQPQPQEDLPFFLSRSIPAITAATAAISAALIKIVPKFSVNQLRIFFLLLNLSPSPLR